MTEPLISVIVPVYKVEQYLQKCVDSIRNQTYRNLEILLVDDGSPDNCGALCDALAQEDDRIRVIHKENGGLSSARNAGLSAMTGDYVGFVDSDDWIAEDTYALLYRRMRDENADISCGGIATHSGSRVLTHFNPNLEETFTFDRKEASRALIDNRIITNSVCDKLYKAEIFRHLRFKEGIVYEDFQLQYRCLALADRVTYTARTCYYYFVAPNSISRGAFSKKQMDFVTNSLERMEFYREHNPESLPACMVAHLDICLSLAGKAYGSAVWKEVQTALTEQIAKPFPEEGEALLPKRLRLQRALYRFSPFLFATLARIYQSLRK